MSFFTKSNKYMLRSFKQYDDGFGSLIKRMPECGVPNSCQITQTGKNKSIKPY